MTGILVRYPPKSFRLAAALFYRDSFVDAIDKLPDSWPDSYLQIAMVLGAVGLDPSMDDVLAIARLAQEMQIGDNAVIDEQLDDGNWSVDCVIVKALLQTLAEKGTGIPEPTLEALLSFCKHPDDLKFVTRAGVLSIDLTLDRWQLSGYAHEDEDELTGTTTYSLENYFIMLRKKEATRTEVDEDSEEVQPPPDNAGIT